MTKYIAYSDCLDYLVYHGNTAIERIRTRAGATVLRDWIYFDSVEEAQTYFNDDC